MTQPSKAILTGNLRPVESDRRTSDILSVEINTENCDYMAVRVVEGITVEPSPLWLQMRLLNMGIKPVNNVQDALAYAMLLYGVPIAAYDLEKHIQGENHVN